MTDHIIKTAVIGYPIKHSKSPLIHGYWHNEHGIHGTYDAIEIAPDHLAAGVQDLIAQGYAGFNVTVPHKVAIMALCDEVDALAQTIGAVNTVVVRDGKLYGSNTDAFGFAHNIKEHVAQQGWSWSFFDGAAVVLGAGGAANAVIYALLQEGVPHITVTNRTRAKAEHLVALSPKRIHVVDWDDRSVACKGAHLVVNTTSLGMAEQPALDLDLSDLSPQGLVTDIVYAPLITPLLAQAQERGLKTVTGIGMLLHQARPAYERWNGVLPDVTDALEQLVIGLE